VPVIPAESPGPPSVASSLAGHPDLAITIPAIPDPAAATDTAVGVARAWAIAAHSSSFLDPTAGSWTARAMPFVTETFAPFWRRRTYAAALYLLPGLAGAIVVLGNRLRRRASSEIVKPRKAA